jgi:hypothetical protein
MPICAKEEASGSPAKSSAASATVENFIFIFICSIELKRETRWAAKYSNETLPGLHRSAIATICNRFNGGERAHLLATSATVQWDGPVIFKRRS